MHLENCILLTSCGYATVVVVNYGSILFPSCLLGPYSFMHDPPEILHMSLTKSSTVSLIYQYFLLILGATYNGYTHLQINNSHKYFAERILYVLLMWCSYLRLDSEILPQICID